MIFQIARLWLNHRGSDRTAHGVCGLLCIGVGKCDYDGSLSGHGDPVLQLVNGKRASYNVVMVPVGWMRMVDGTRGVPATMRSMVFTGLNSASDMLHDRTVVRFSIKT